VFIVLILSAPAGATAPTGFTKTPPFRGSTASVGSYALPSPATPCARAFAGSPTPWHPHSGAIESNVSISGRSSASCNSKIYCGANLTCASTDVSVLIPIRTPARSGTYQLEVNYTIHASVQWSRWFGGCSNCSALFEDELSLGACPQFFDLTTNSSVPSSSYCSLPTFGYAFLGAYTRSGTHLRALSAGGDGYLNGSKLNSTNRYAVLFPDIQIWANLDLSGMPRTGYAKVTNDFDMASKGNGFFINNVSVR
jgi:hypothetical protein